MDIKEIETNVSIKIISKTEYVDPKVENENQQLDVDGIVMKTELAIEATNSENVECENMSKQENDPDVGKAFKCDMCFKGFVKKQKLVSHVKSVHYKIQPFKCETCLRLFSQNHSLLRHKRTIHKTYECGFCKRRFGEKHT